MTDRLDDLTRPGAREQETWREESDVRGDSTGATDAGDGLATTGAGQDDPAAAEDGPIMRDHSEMEEAGSENEPRGDPTILGLRDGPGGF